MGTIQEDESLSVDARREMMARLEAEYAGKSEKIHVIHQLLKAYTLFQRDEKYIIGEGGEVVIVDEFTGRQMSGRRWSDGLHQAVEAKEGVEIKGETQTLATITIQNYFRMYEKLSGMTGTAETEETEFHQIYKLDVFVIPTNRPIIRDDRDDLIFRTKREKYQALMDEVERLHRMELPVLLGTTNVEISETLSRMLKRRGIPHNVLNAKQHKKESEIVAEAGQTGAVTIATNMAGRGTDIKLGEGVVEARTVGWAKERGLDLEELVPVDPTQEMGFEDKPDDFVIQVGGLQILGSERHESRRIDRQLRGRSGRQGDPGSSQFFISVEDDLMRLFVGDRLATAMDRLGASEGEVITHPMVTRAIETAQKRVEGNNFESRKRLLDYDDVMNQQREVIYDRRLFALEGGEDLKGEMWEMIEHTVQSTVDEYLDSDHEEEWDLSGLKRRITLDYFASLKDLPDENDEEHELEAHEIQTMAVDAVHEQFQKKIDGFGDHAEFVTSSIMLSVIDGKWKDHLYDLDHLKASIGFRGWGQKDPLVEYKKEAYEMFVDLMDDLRRTVGNLLFKAQLGQPRQPARQPQMMQYSGPTEDGAASGALAQAAAARGTQALGGGGHVDDLGMARGTRSDGAGRGKPAPLGSVGGVPSPQDPRELVTNREERVRAPVTATKEPGRNEPCPCGSGKKYKKCHGRGV
jgi:preprotein translocase subunit SecA